MFVLTPATIALCVCVPLLAYFLVKWFCTKDTEAENRRRAAAKLASKLQAIGLRKLPEFLIDYHALSELFLAGDEPVLAEVDTVFRNVLDAKLKTDEGRAFIAAKLAEATKAVAPVVAAAAPAVAAAVVAA